MTPTIHAAAVEEETLPETEPIPPEILAVIAAAATAFLGKNLRIQSAALLHAPYGDVNKWTRTGRASAIASHNLRSKR